MKTLFISFIAFLFFSIPTVSYACVCGMGDSASAFYSAKTVFTGRMLGGTEKLSVKDRQGNEREIESGAVRFSVQELFKGNTPGEITIAIDSMKGTSCGDYGLERGEVYLVYAYENENEEMLYSGVCTRTSKLNNEYIKEDLEFLRNLPPAGTGGNLEGRIWVDVKTVEGGGAEPLPDVKVKIVGDNGEVFNTMTDKDGNFELRKIRAGKYRVEPELPEKYYVEDESEIVEVNDRGTANVGFEVYFNGKINGRIVDKNGVGYNSAFLQLLSTHKNKIQREVYGHSDGESGVFSIKGIPPGEYFLSIELQNEDYEKNRYYFYPGTFNRENATPIKIGLGGKVEGLNFILPNEFQVKTIEGQVFWKDGKPASGAAVLLLCPKSTDSNGFAIEFSPPQTKTDDEGKFKIEGFSGASYSIQARGYKEDIAFQSQPKKMVLKESLKNIKIDLTEEGIYGSCVN